MATLGNTSPAFNYWSYYFGGNNQVGTSLYTMPVNGTVSSITFFMAGQNASVNATGCIWSNSGTLLASGPAISVGSGNDSIGGQRWNTVGINLYLAAGTQIRIGWWHTESQGAVWSTGPGTGYECSTAGGPSSFATTTAIGNIGAYITYTPISAPTVATYAATNINYTSASLVGAANPNGSDTHAYFQWGTTNSYGNSTATADIGSGSGAVNVGIVTSGLTGGTTYHYRIVAYNSAGTTYGADSVFTTPVQYVAPKAPTLTAPTAGGSIDASNGVTLTGIYNSQDGYYQSAYQLTVKLNSGATQYWNGTALQTGSIWVTDSNNTAAGQPFSVFLSSSIITNGTTGTPHVYTWAMASQEGGNSLQGPLATALTFTAKTEPTWSDPYNPQTAVQDHINQFHVTHRIAQLFEAARVETLPTAHTGFTPLITTAGATSYAGAFTLATGTAVGRVEIPVSLIATEGTACDVQVALVNDSAGIPGTTTSASTVIPADILLRMAGVSGDSSNMPRFQQDVIGTWTASTPTPSFYQEPMCAGAPSNLVQVGGNTTGVPGTGVNNVFIGQFNAATGAYQSWAAGPAYPIAISDGAAAYLNGYVYVAGGVNTSNVSVANVYSCALNDATSTMGTWNAQAAIGTAGSALHAATDGTTLYVIGGDNGGTETATIWYAQPSNGNISAWNTATYPYPVAGHTAICINGYLVVMGGYNTNFANASATTDVYYAKINTDGSLGAFQQGPAMPAARSRHVALTYGNNIIVCGGQDTSGVGQMTAWTIGAIISGSRIAWGKWTTMNPLPITTLGPGGAGFLLSSGQFAVSILTGNNNSNGSVLATSTVVPYVSVPLVASGLTNGAKYWITLTPLEENPVNVPQVSVNTSGGVGYARQLPGAAWTSISASQSLNVRVYDQSVSGRKINVSEDSGADWTWIIYNETTGQPTYFAECIARTNVPSVAVMYEFNYNADGSLASVL